MKAFAGRAGLCGIAAGKHPRSPIYGPDLGLVRERAEIATKAIAGDLGDPFNVVEFTPGALRDEPSRLTDEACSIHRGGASYACARQQTP